jgi:hypothetical protein
VSILPAHGRINCRKCFEEETAFDLTTTAGNDWRITNNPLAWGSSEPEVIVLGFSKGPTQSGALANSPHNSIAYKGSRLNVGKILAHIGLVEAGPDEQLRNRIDDLIADPKGRFHFGSLIRCTVERFDPNAQSWKGTGGGMLDKFIATDFGSRIVSNCTERFLGELPTSVRLIVMFGLGTKQGYVRECFQLYRKTVPGEWRDMNLVSYTNESLTVVHVEHFASQGALIPNWLGKKNHPRSALGIMAKESAHSALGI